MARSSRTGRYIVARPRLVGTRLRPRIAGADFSGAEEVSGVLAGEPIVLGGAPEPEPAPAPKTTKASSSSA